MSDDKIKALRDEIISLVDRMPLDQLERARDVVRDIDIESRIGTRSQFEEIEEELRQFELEPLPDDIAAAIEREVVPPLVVHPEGLPDSVAARLQEIADRHPELPRDPDRRLEVLRLIVFALEAGGITGHEQPDFAAEHGEPPDFFPRHRASRCRDVSLDRLAALYDVAAQRVGWRSFKEIVRGYHDDVRGGSR